MVIVQSLMRGVCEQGVNAVTPSYLYILNLLIVQTLILASKAQSFGWAFCTIWT